MQKFLTTAPVVAAIWFTLTAGILNRVEPFLPRPALPPHVIWACPISKKGGFGPLFLMPSTQSHQSFQLQQSLIKIVVNHNSIEFTLGA